jgi:hypothetical protein
MTPEKKQKKATNCVMLMLQLAAIGSHQTKKLRDELKNVKSTDYKDFYDYFKNRLQTI